jgi:hypothetical protein
MFSLSFFEYRNQVHQIARKNWENIADLEDIFVSDGSHRETLGIINKLRQIKDACILPIDDDDWTTPNIKKELEPYSHHPVIHWVQSTYDPYDNRPSFLLRSAQPFTFFTNNYAYSPFVYSFVNKFKQAEMTLMHLYFNDAIREQIFEPIRCNWTTIHKSYGVTNKTLASLSKLNKKNSMTHFRNCVDRHKTIADDPIGYKTLLQEASWALQPIKETEKLHKTLADSKRWLDVRNPRDLGKRYKSNNEDGGSISIQRP